MLNPVKCLLLALAALVSPATRTEADQTWWSLLPCEVLADLVLDEDVVVTDDDSFASLTLLPEPWQVRAGAVTIERAIDPADGDQLTALEQSIDDILLSSF